MNDATVADAAKHLVTITVNSKHVEVRGPRATGLEIKQAAINAGVDIQLSFQLTVGLGGNRTRVVGDDELVTVKNDLVFTAVAEDDNS